MPNKKYIMDKVVDWLSHEDSFTLEERLDDFQQWMIENCHKLPEDTLEIILKNVETSKDRKGTVNAAITSYLDCGDDFEVNQIMDGNHVPLIDSWFQHADADAIAFHLHDLDDVKRADVTNAIVDPMDEGIVAAVVEDLGIDATIEGLNKVLMERYTTDAIQDILSRCRP